MSKYNKWEIDHLKLIEGIYICSILVKFVCNQVQKFNLNL